MKTLHLVRHAKSSWDDLQLSDFERPLNARGKKDAPAVAKKIKDKEGIKIDRFISSPAKRARKTASVFMKEFGLKNKEMVLLPSLYEASVNNFYDAVESMNDEDETVAVFSHNPGITDFVNTLTEK